MWGFYPDDTNPHRVGFSCVPVPLDMFTYWIEPGWMREYMCMAAAARKVAPCARLGPNPPDELLVPAGFGMPDDWDDARHAAAKIECWQLTAHGWGVTRRLMLTRD